MDMAAIVASATRLSSRSAPRSLATGYHREFNKAARWLDGRPCWISPQSVNDHGRAVSDLLWM